MARTLTQVRQLVAQQLGLNFISGTADAGGSTTTLVDAPLKVYPDGRLVGNWIYLTSGSPSLTELQITSFTSSSGTATFIPALGAAPDALTYEILPFSATEILRAIQESVLSLYDSGHLVREHWIRMVAGSSLYNADFAYWTSSTTPDGWGKAGSGTIARERASANIGPSETSLKLSGTADYVALQNPWKRFIWDRRQSQVYFYCYVWCASASTARINLYVDGNNYSAYHGGTSDWELLNVNLTIPLTATTIEPRLYNDVTSNVVYFSLPFLTGGPMPTEYPFPIALMPDGPSEVRIGQSNIRRDAIASGRGYANLREFWNARGLSEYGFIKYHDENSGNPIGILDLSETRRPPMQNEIMTAIGDGPLTIPTVDGDTLECNYSESLLLATDAALRLLQKEMVKAPSTLQSQYGDRAARLYKQREELVAGVGQSRGSAALPMKW